MQIEFGKWGNSVGVRIPSAMLKNLGIAAGSTGTMELREGGIFLAPLKRQLSLQEMIASLPEAPEGEFDTGEETGHEGVQW